MSKNEQLAKKAIKDILLRQVPKEDRVKWTNRRPTKEELETKWRLVKEPD